MRKEVNKMLDLIKRTLDAFGASDWDAYKATLAPDVIYEEIATRRRVASADELVALNKGWKSAFPDAKGIVKSFYASGDVAIAEVEWEGTHKGALEGPFGALPASNKRVKLGAVLIHKVKDGKISEVRHYFDLFGMLQMLGAPMVSAAAPKEARPVVH
jgi:steroid delta-isomerase-like uncharacterized protein